MAEGIPTWRTRKRRSEQRLAALKVPVSRALPLLDFSVPVRPAREVARRALVLWYFDRLPRATLLAWLERERLTSALTERELRHLRARRPDAGLTSSAEAAQALLWALDCVEQLAPLDRSVERPWVSRRVPAVGEPTANFVRSAQLRPEARLRSAADLAYRSLWTILEARHRGRAHRLGWLEEVANAQKAALLWVAGHDWADEHGFRIGVGPAQPSSRSPSTRRR